MTFIPFLLFIKNAEGNFRKSQLKSISAKRRDRLDKEHGIDRKQLQDDYKQLDITYRITEKDEIKKYQELGKTAKQYYEDQEKIGRDVATGTSDLAEKPSMEVLRETLMKRETDGDMEY